MPLARKTNVRHTAIAHLSVNETNVGSPLAASSPTSSTVTKAMMVSNIKSGIEDYYRQKLEKLEMMRVLTLNHLNNGIGDIVYSDSNVDQPFHASIYQNILIALKANCPGYEHIQTSEICKEMPPPPGTTVVKKRVTRTTMKGSKKRSSGSGTRTIKKSKRSTPLGLKTPTSKGRPYQVAAVTPGYRVQTPSVYRKPCAGEQIISMSGSPILVPTENMANVPQMHIPLADGRVFAVMPQGTKIDDMPDFPDVDPETKKQLRMLRQYLETKILD